MAVQNMYNNYIKRQQTNPTNQFRQKVANSLSGKAVGNNTTKKTPSMMGNKSVNTLGATVQPKPQQNNARSVQPTTNSLTNGSTNPLTNSTTNLSTNGSTNSTTNGYTNSPVKSVSIGEGMFVGDMPQNVLESNIQAQNATSEPTQTTNAEATGMMSLSDINDAIKGETSNQPTETQLTDEDIAEINELSHNPQVVSMARASNKTPQQMAQELIESQKQTLKEQWEQQKKELELQKNQLQQSYDQSVKDAETSYKDTEKTLQENRYIQQENLAVSGQRRGIQYSPQQLALENVANINLNKNLAEASTKRNELLNQLTMQLSQSMANVTMGLQNASVEYNKNVSQLMADYQKQMMDWAYNDQQTEADREWQEEQTKKDQAFQKEMANLQNKWQAEQNALDRKQYGKSGGRSGGYSYGRSYTPYSSYKGRARSAYDSWGNYSMNDLDLSTDEGAEAFGNTFKQYSTDLYNAVDVGGMYDVNSRGRIYADEIDQYIDYAKANGASKEVVDELEKTRQVATNHLFNKSYARDTNSAIKIGDTLYKSSTPVRDDYVRKVKSTKQLSRAKFDEATARTKEEAKKQKVNANFHKNAGQGRTLNDLEKFAKKKAETKKQTTTKKQTETKKVQKTTKAPLKPITKKSSSQAKKEVKNTVQSSTMSKLMANKNNKNKVSPAKKSQSNVKKTVAKKSTNKTVQRNQSKLQKSFNNLKKNIKKLFKR